MKRKIQFSFPQFPIPVWLFAMLTIGYCETLLHLWITPDPLPWRFAVVVAFGLGFGGFLGLLLSFLPNRSWRKWGSTGLIGLVSAFYLVEFFVRDSYTTFMPLGTLLSGAGNVARDFLDPVIDAVTNGWWRILLILLPAILFAIFANPPKSGRKDRCILLAAILLAYVSGFGTVRNYRLDMDRFTSAYNFDTAISCFGLNMGMILDLGKSLQADTSPTFETPVQTEPPRETVPEETEQTEASEAPEESAEPENTEPVPEYGYNVMDIDFETLATSTGNGNVKAVHSYVSSLTPTKQNAYTGLFKGKNLILITAEAFTAEVIDPERTPTLYRMATEGIQFKDYYQPAWGGSTTTGEYSNLMGLVPTNSGNCMRETKQQKMFLTMGHQLGKLGYHGVAYHNHNHDFYSRNETHTRLGYDQFLALYGGLEGITPLFPESDLEMMDVTVPQYIDKQPFSIYYMTVSGHSVYTRKNHMSDKNYEMYADMDASEPVKCYYAANQELEYAMESLLRQLDEAGISDDTVIVIATDHYPYGLAKSSTWENSRDYLPELYGVSSYDQFIRDHNALIIWSGCIEDMDIVVDTPVYSLDILPTLSNPFGVEYDSRLLIGRDVFSDAMPLALWPDFSWKTDRGSYVSTTGIFTPNEGQQADQAYIDYVTTLVKNKITFSRSVQDLDYYNYLLPYIE